MKNYELGTELFQFPNGARVFEAERKSDKERAMVLCFPRLEGVDVGVYTRAESIVEQLREGHFTPILDVSVSDTEYAFCIAYRWDDKFIPLKEVGHRELWIMCAVAKILQSLDTRGVRGCFAGEQAVFVNQENFSVRLGFVGLMEVFSAHSEEAQPQKPDWQDDVYHLARCFEIPESCSVIRNCLAEDKQKRPRYPVLLKEMSKTYLFRPDYSEGILLCFAPKCDSKSADELVTHLNLNDCYWSQWESDEKNGRKCEFHTKEFKGAFINNPGDKHFFVPRFMRASFSPFGEILRARFCRVTQGIKCEGEEYHHLAKLNSEKSEIVNSWRIVPEKEKEYIEETSFKSDYFHIREVRDSSVRKFSFLLKEEVTWGEVDALKQKEKHLESVPMLVKSHHGGVDVGLVDDITSRLVVFARMGKEVQFPQGEDSGVLIGHGIKMPFDFSWQHGKQRFFAAESNLAKEQLQQLKAKIDKSVEGGDANFVVKVKEQDYALEEIRKCEILREIITRDAKEGLRGIPTQGTLQENYHLEIIPFNRQINAVDKFDSGDMAEASLRCSLATPSEHRSRIVPPLEIQWFDENLDEAQKNAVKGALSQKPLFLIQGPPGTGKTTVIVEIILQILKQNPKAHILVCSQTNLAVDNVIERLPDKKKNNRKNIRKIRLISSVSQDKVVPGVKPFLYERRLRTWISVVRNRNKQANELLAKPKRQTEMSRALAKAMGTKATETKAMEGYEEESRKREKEIRIGRVIKQWHAFLGKHDNDDCLIRGNGEGGWSHLKEAFLKSMNVIGATCVHIASNAYREVLRGTYDFLLLDEAAKATPAETMIPIVRAKQIVLIGDDKQLSPFVTAERGVWDKVKEEKEELEDKGIENLRRDFGVSLFEYLLPPALPKEICIMLNVQRRMPQQIGKLISEYFYNGELESPSDEEYAHTKRLSLPFKRETALVYINTFKRREPYDNDRSTWRQNPCNAKVIVETLYCLNSKVKGYSKKSPLDVAIIAAYRGQVQLLEKEVKRANQQSPFDHLNFEIKTVDSFQGRENTIVIYDIVRSSRGESDVGFLDDPKRLNVALSRAQKLLIIVGDADYLINRARPGKMRMEKKGAKRPILGEIAEEIQQQGFIVDSLEELLDD